MLIQLQVVIFYPISLQGYNDKNYILPILFIFIFIIINYNYYIYYHSYYLC